MQAKLDAATEESSHYETRISTLQQQLKEAQTGTVQGVAALHEEIRQMVLNTEQMRIDHRCVTTSFTMILHFLCSDCCCDHNFCSHKRSHPVVLCFPHCFQNLSSSFTVRSSSRTSCAKRI